MRILHTSDWHVGKSVRGRSRAGEHHAVLAEIAEIADREVVDLVLVVGDLFDSAAPPPEAERIVYGALLDLSSGGRPVVVVSGNHDNPRRLSAVAPVFGSCNVHVQATVAPVAEGGVLALEVGGVPVRIALMPFLSQRHIVAADDLMSNDGSDHGRQYADRSRRIIESLSSGFEADAVNLMAVHAMVAGGVLGGGERSAHTIFEYSIPSTAFPPSTHYVALGHLHRAQEIAGPCPIRYSGSPLQMDFGETANRNAVLVVDAVPGLPVTVNSVPLESGRRFRTVRGRLDELASQVRDDDDDSFVRVIVSEAVRVGLADEVRELFPDAVEIKVEPPDNLAGDARASAVDVDGEVVSAHDQFVAYLQANSIDDPRLVSLFDELFDEANGRENEIDDAA